MKAKKENTSRAFGFIFWFFVFYFFVFVFFKKVDKLCILHSQQIFLYILHLNRSTQLPLKMQYYLSNIYFITVFCKFVCQDKLDVLGIKHVYLGAKYDC